MVRRCVLILMCPPNVGFNVGSAWHTENAACVSYVGARAQNSMLTLCLVSARVEGGGPTIFRFHCALLDGTAKMPRLMLHLPRNLQLACVRVSVWRPTNLDVNLTPHGTRTQRYPELIIILYTNLTTAHRITGTSCFVAHMREKHLA